MDITELLVTAYRGENPAFAVTLTPGTATVVHTGTDIDDQVVVEDISHHRTDDTFTLMRRLMQGLIPAHSPQAD